MLAAIATETFNIATKTFNIATETFNIATETFNIATETFNVATETFNVNIYFTKDYLHDDVKISFNSAQKINPIISSLVIGLKWH